MKEIKNETVFSQNLTLASTHTHFFNLMILDTIPFKVYPGLKRVKL